MSDLRGKFLKSLQNFEGDNGGAIDSGSNLSKFAENLEKDLVEIIKDTEQNFSKRPNYNPWPLISKPENVSPAEHLFAAALFAGMYFCKKDRESRRELDQTLNGFSVAYFKPIKLAQNDFEEISESINTGTQAAFNPKHNQILFRGLPKSVWSDTIESNGGLPGILRPLYGLTTEHYTSHLDFKIVHEATHAFVYQNTVYDRDRKDLREIEESVASALSQIIRDDFEFYSEGYEEMHSYDTERVRKNMRLIEKASPSSSPVDFCRAIGVQAIKLGIQNSGYSSTQLISKTIEMKK
jgi:hypothetical protein